MSYCEPGLRQRKMDSSLSCACLYMKRVFVSTVLATVSVECVIYVDYDHLFPIDLNDEHVPLNESTPSLPTSVHALWNTKQCNCSMSILVQTNIRTYSQHHV